MTGRWWCLVPEEEADSFFPHPAILSQQRSVPSHPPPAWRWGPKLSMSANKRSRSFPNFCETHKILWNKLYILSIITSKREVSLRWNMLKRFHVLFWIANCRELNRTFFFFSPREHMQCWQQACFDVQDIFASRQIHAVSNVWESNPPLCQRLYESSQPSATTYDETPGWQSCSINTKQNELVWQYSSQNNTQ